MHENLLDVNFEWMRKQPSQLAETQNWMTLDCLKMTELL